MASYNITAQVGRLLALGATEAQILASGPRVVKFSDSDWEAQNRATTNALDQLEASLERKAAKAQAATDIISKIRGGQVLYTKAADGQWLVWGREDIITDGATVTATRKDGTTQTIVITRTGPVRDRDGLRYRTAEFRTTRGLETDPMEQEGLTGAAAEALRIGRSYGVNGQIWDNA